MFRSALLLALISLAAGAAPSVAAESAAVLQGFGTGERSVVFKLSKPAGFKVQRVASTLVVTLSEVTPSEAALAASLATRLVTGVKVGTSLASEDSLSLDTQVVLSLDAPRDYSATWMGTDLVIEILSRLPAGGAARPSAPQAKAPAGTPLGYPGSTWSEFSRDLDGLEGNATMGNVRQGVDWVKLPGGLVFNTFATYRWRFRSELRPFFNAHGPGVGFNVNRGPVEVGMDFSWIRYPEAPRDRYNRDFEVYGSWYKRWDLGASFGLPALGGASPLGLPFSAWGRLHYDVNRVEGGGSQGWIRQGIDWFKVWGATFDTFGEYRWRLRTENKRFYNVHGPAVGARLQRSPFDLALSYAWRTYPQLDRITRNLDLTFSWFFGWDLKRP